MKHHALNQQLSRQGLYSFRLQIHQSRTQSTSASGLGPQRRDSFWSPTPKLLPKSSEQVDITTLLSAAGFIRQNYAGIYQFLPLGLRVLEKIERLIDKHMRSVGASKVSLSSISSQSLWDRSGRLGHGEMYRFEDRAKGKWLLAPTHEEEVTTMVQEYVKHPFQLPLRLYQTGRKYRDEQRPRGGLLRGREFIMKDLYTFDKSTHDAEITYRQIRTAYRNFFTELGVPFVEVRADSGNMGGDLSHEFHFPNSAGEDTVITCNECDYATNEELVPRLHTRTHRLEVASTSSAQPEDPLKVDAHSFISKDSKTLVRVLLKPTSSEKLSTTRGRNSINTYTLKAVLNHEGIELDTGAESSNAEERFSELSPSLDGQSDPPQIYYLVDNEVCLEEVEAQAACDQLKKSERHPATLIVPAEANGPDFRLLRHQSGDDCPHCKTGTLKVQQAIEIGHTFHLGTRYTSRFDFRVPTNAVRGLQAINQPFIEMGCHGIGVSRLLAAAAACLSTRNQLQWPIAIAPYEVVLLTDGKNKKSLRTAHKLYDELSAHGADVLIDDRQNAAIAWKMKDAAAVGYPVVVVLGKALEHEKVEFVPVHGESEDVPIKDAVEHVLAKTQKNNV